MATSSSSSNTTVTLLAEAGRMWAEKKEAIGTHERSIVFLPPGVKPDERVRVVLEEVRPDARGRMMYRGKKAPVVYEDRWRANADGTLSRVTFAIDWLCKESEEGVCETRAAASREVPGSTTTKWTIVWGLSLADSYLERTVEKAFVTEVESVQAGKLVSTRRSERREIGAGEMVLVKSVSPAYSYTHWQPPGLSVVCPDATDVPLAVAIDDGGNASSVALNDTWGNLPQWLRDELLADYPVCGCGRRRLDVKNPAADGYAKCQTCRDEESCGRCGVQPDEKPLGVAVVDGRLVCPSCVSMARLEAIVAPIATIERRERVAQDAARLLAARALPADVGQLVFEAGLGHVVDNYARSRVVARGSGFGWFYVTKDGAIEASKFPPEALEVLQHFAGAQGDGLVRLTSWFMGDVYERTQVRGETVALEGCSLEQLRYGGDDAFAVARKLRGSAADREAAVDGYARLVAALGEHAPEVYEIREALQGESQDYASALAKVRAAEAAYQTKLEEAAREAVVREQLLTLVQTHYPQCPICEGQLAWQAEQLNSWHERGTCVCDVCPCRGPDVQLVKSAFEALGAGWGSVETRVDGRTAKVLRQTLAGDAGGQVPVAELVTYYKYGGWNLTLVFHPENFGRGDWTSANCWRLPTNKELQLHNLEKLNETYPNQVASAESQVGEGGVVKLAFRRKTNDRTGQLEWIAGERRDGLLYVVERRAEKGIKEGKTYYCTVGRALVDTPRFRLMLVTPFLQVGLDIVAERRRIEVGEEEKPAVVITPPPARPAVPVPTSASLDALKGRFNKKR